MTRERGSAQTSHYQPPLYRMGKLLLEVPSSPWVGPEFVQHTVTPRGHDGLQATDIQAPPTAIVARENDQRVVIDAPEHARGEVVDEIEDAAKQQTSGMRAAHWRLRAAVTLPTPSSRILVMAHIFVEMVVVMEMAVSDAIALFMR